MQTRFAFGRNWRRYSARIDEMAIAQAEASLRDLLGRQRLDGLRLLDVGSGSGLFSLAARRLGASVVSFDVDADSVACTEELRERYGIAADGWRVEHGSALDPNYLQALGWFDIVYSWGVLHHTGAMWQALENLLPLVGKDGHLALAIYNDQGRRTQAWARVKWLYNTLPSPFRPLLLGFAALRLWAPTVLRDGVRGDPLATWRDYGTPRGMSAWHDVVDWVGGWPFEVAKPEEVFDFCRSRGFELRGLRTCGPGHGCNEFVFQRANLLPDA